MVVTITQKKCEYQAYYNKGNNCIIIELRDEFDGPSGTFWGDWRCIYEIDLDERTKAVTILDMLFHLTGKTWIQDNPKLFLDIVNLWVEQHGYPGYHEKKRLVSGLSLTER